MDPALTLGLGTWGVLGAALGGFFTVVLGVELVIELVRSALADSGSVGDV